MELFQEPLTAIHPGNLSNTLIDKYGRIAKSFAITGWFGLQGDMNQRTAQAFAKLMTGAELGLGPMASMRCIHALSDGKIELHAILIAALIRRSPKYDYKVLLRNDKECKVEFFNTEAEEPISLGISHWDLERAKKAELGKSRSGKKTNWQKHAQSMLFARCMTDGERTYCPDVVMVGPLYGIGEIDTLEAQAPDVMEVAKQLAKEEITALPLEEPAVPANVHQLPAHEKEDDKSADSMFEQMKRWSEEQMFQGKTIEHIRGQCLKFMIPKIPDKQVQEAAKEWVHNEWQVAM